MAYNVWITPSLFSAGDEIPPEQIRGVFAEASTHDSNRYVRSRGRTEGMIFSIAL